MVYCRHGDSIDSNHRSIFVHFFLGPFGVSTDHQAWASFGGYFGGILGPVLSFANLLAIAWIATVVVSQQHEHISRKQLTLDMLAEYHSEPMHQTRIALDEWIEDIVRNSGTLPPLSKLERTKDDRRINAFHLYHYFEKWALLARTENIDNRLLIEALGSRVIWWQENFFRQIAASEKDNQILKSLREIDNHVLSKIPPNDIYFLMLFVMILASKYPLSKMLTMTRIYSIAALFISISAYGHAKEPQCSPKKHASVPEITAMTYHKAREILLAKGWKPLQTKKSSLLQTIQTLPMETVRIFGLKATSKWKHAYEQAPRPVRSSSRISTEQRFGYSLHVKKYSNQRHLPAFLAFDSSATKKALKCHRC